MVYCYNCGTQAEDTDGFCRECGVPLDPEKDAQKSSDNILSSVVAKSTRTDQVSAEGISLLGGEEVLVNTHPSITMYPGSLLAAVILSLLLLFPALFSGDIGVVTGALIGAVLFSGSIIALAYFLVRRNRYIVTNRRVLHHYHLFGEKTKEVRIDSIRSIETKRGFIESLLGHGEVEVDSTGEGGHIEFIGLSNYKEVAQAIGNAQQNFPSR